MERLEEITLFYEISKALNEHLDLKKSLYQVLDIIEEFMGMVRGTITILNPVSNQINIEVAHGLSKSAMKREFSSEFIRIFSGFKSRCQIFFPCATSSPFRIIEKKRRLCSPVKPKFICLRNVEEMYGIT